MQPSGLLARVKIELRERLDELRPLYEEHQRLLAASEALDALEGPIGLDEAQKPFTPDAERAPYGYKSDGVTPRKRPGSERTPHDAEAPWGRKKDGTPKKQPGRRKGQVRPDLEAKPQTIKLRVISSTAPTEDELKDREVAHVTSEPA